MENESLNSIDTIKERLEKLSMEELIEANELEDELEQRDEMEAAKYYVPNGKAEQFIKLVGSDKCFVNMFIGANGTSKTSCGVNIIASIIFGPQNKWFEYPLFKRWPYIKKGRIISDPTTIKEKIIPELIKWLPRNTYKNFPEKLYKTSKNGKFYASKFIFNNGWNIDIMCLRPDQRVLMVSGVEKEIKDLKIGDRIKSSEGNTEIKKIYKSTADKFYKIRTSKGNEIICSGKHKILSKNGWIKASDLKIGDRMISNFPQIESTEKIEKWQAFMLGILLGDGDIKRMQVLWTCFSPKLIEYAKNILPPELKVQQVKNVEGRFTISITQAVKNNPLKKWLKDIGIWGKGSWDKFIPDIIFCCDNDILKEVLRGLFSTDGSCNTNGHTILYYSRSERLCQDVKKLLRRLGIISKVYGYYRECEFDGYNCDGMVYTCQISDNKSLKLFKENIGFIGKDFDLNNSMKMGNSVEKGNKISKIEIIEGGDCLDLEVKSNTHDYIVDGFVVHNSNEQDVKSFESVDLGFLWCDEPLPKDRFLASLARGRLGMIVFWTYTPLFYAGWIKDWIDEHIQEKIVDYIEAEAEDNCLIHGVRGFFEHKAIKRMADSFPEDEREARIFGKFGHLLGRVHKRFNRKIHVVKPFPINEKDWTTYKALDPHPRVQDHVMYLSVNNRGTKIVTAELLSDGLVKTLYSRMIELETKMHFRIEDRIIDPSAFNESHHTKEASVGSQLFLLGERWIKGSKNLMAGVKRVEDAFDYEMKGGKFIKEPELFIFDTCPTTIKQLEEYVWSEYKGASADSKEKSGRPQDKNDHQPENLHRLMLHEPKHIPWQLRQKNSPSPKSSGSSEIADYGFNPY